MRLRRSGSRLPGSTGHLKALLDTAADKYNCTDFIPGDPISIPHRYSRLQDIEIAAFWTAIMSWGQRKTIIQKASQLFSLMDDAPYDFVRGHLEKDRKRFLHFCHRTFQPTDTLYFLEFFQQYYHRQHSLEEAFVTAKDGKTGSVFVKESLSNFADLFFASPLAPARTRKHISSPARNAACKRLNMFLRWMVRSDERGVDLGLWKQITPADLMIPLDVHVFRVASALELLRRKATDWKAVEELTARLCEFDPADPVRYDFALFGMGVMEGRVV